MSTSVTLRPARAKLIASCVALVLVSVLLVTLSSSPAEAGPGGILAGENGTGYMPAPHEWVMVLLLFALVIAFHHCRAAHRQNV